MFQAGRARTGVVTDLTIGASSASRLTVKWKTLVASGTGVLASPAVAFITQLHKPLVFAATTTGTVTARDLATTGAVIWTSAGNGPIVASPAVSGNTVYVGTESHYLFAFDAATGAVQCAFSLGGAVVSSPVVGQVDRTGPVVFFGDVGAGVANSPGHLWGDQWCRQRRRAVYRPVGLRAMEQRRSCSQTDRDVLSARTDDRFVGPAAVGLRQQRPRRLGRRANRPANVAVRAGFGRLLQLSVGVGIVGRPGLPHR